MSDELDPEVLADLRLRAASEHDSSRDRPAAELLGTWKPDSEFVVQWKCRNPKCNTMVPVVDVAVDRLEKFNAILRDRNEREIPNDAVVLCQPCIAIAAWYRTDALIKRKERMKQLVQALKNSSSPKNEHEILAQLRNEHHPDIQGLLDAITRDKPSAKRKARGGL